ncbi:MAG: hypothetical protein WAW13_04725 [Minisyncoccia bacterium]
MNNSLESSKFFPYIAWTVVIGFALFTYMLTVRLQTELSDISSGVERLEQKLNELDAKNSTSTKR